MRQLSLQKQLRNTLVVRQDNSRSLYMTQYTNETSVKERLMKILYTGRKEDISLMDKPKKSQKPSKNKKNFLLHNIKKFSTQITSSQIEKTPILENNNTTITLNDMYNYKKLYTQMRQQCPLNMKQEMKGLLDRRKSRILFDRLQNSFKMNRRSSLDNDYTKISRIQYNQLTDNDNNKDQRFKRHTQSSIRKKSAIMKQKVFEQVFEENKNSKLGQKKTDYYDQEKKKLKRIYKKRQEENKVRKQKNEFKALIYKLSNFNSVFDGDITNNDLGQTLKQKFLEQQQNQRKQMMKRKKLLYSLKEMNIQATKKNMERSYIRLDTLQDLQKIDPKFCEDLIQHRSKRLSQMQSEIRKTQKIRSSSPQNSSHINLSSLINKHSVKPFHLEQTSQRAVITNQSELQQQYEKYSKLQLAQKFKYIIRNITQLMDNATRYLIPQQFIYKALFRNHVQYELEGSYLFFKSIHINRFQTVEAFVENTHAMVYNIDEFGRTPLLLACQLNQTHTAKYLLTKGVHVDAVAYDKKPSLYYAILNKNLEIAKQLLQHGANCWSSNYYNYTQMTQKYDKMRILLRNARKVWIAMRLNKLSRRMKLWEQLRQRIMYDELIQF